VKAPAAELRIDAAEQRLILSGDWGDGAVQPDPTPALEQIGAHRGSWTLDVARVDATGVRLDATLLRLARAAQADGDFRLQGATPARERLIALACAVPPMPTPMDTGPGLFSGAAWRTRFAEVGEGLLGSLAFLGELVTGLGRTLVGRSDLRGRELLAACSRAGPDALGIIALTSILVGMILAYLGAAQLQQFGAAIYVADLVTIGMLREMGALMTAVVMSGRTGAAYAAQLSTMQTNEEIDAIRTLGINPMEYLVVPRVLGLVLMMPLLVIFADTLGIAGGALVAGGMGVTPLQYVNQVSTSLSVTHFSVGLVKAAIFALLIAIAGCRAGMTSGRSSAAVGRATTDAVVTALIYLIVADAAINIICQQLQI